MTSQEIRQRFRSPVLDEVAEVLDIIQRTPAGAANTNCG